MNAEKNPMEKFNFLLGKWKLISEVPKSRFSEFDTGEGVGEFKRILNDKYITFDYESKYSQGEGAAHGIFTWDNRKKIYRYWWFENSGEYDQATCDFIDDKTLALNWNNSLMVQTFQLTEDGNINLEMRYPENKDDFQIVLKVLFEKLDD